MRSHFDRRNMNRMWQPPTHSGKDKRTSSAPSVLSSTRSSSGTPTTKTPPWTSRDAPASTSSDYPDSATSTSTCPGRYQFSTTDLGPGHLRPLRDPTTPEA